MILGFVIWSLMGLMIAGLGIHSLRSENAVGFFAGVEPPKVKDVKKYFDKKNIQIIYMYLNQNDKKLFENKYGVNNLPKIIYFKDGVLKDYIVFDNNTIEEFLIRNGLLQ